MKIAFFDAHKFEVPIFNAMNVQFKNDITYFETRMIEGSEKLADGFPVICSFANDRLNAQVLRNLKKGGVELIALRSAGFNHVDMPVAFEMGLRVVRVPAYSPYAIAEHAVALILSLNRKICRASSRVHDLNFSLDGLMGYDLHGKTVGIIGTGRIGSVMAKIMSGFGCQVLAYDLLPQPANSGIQSVSLAELYRLSDIISLHVPLTASTQHLVDASAFAQMKRGATLINTGSGGLIDTKALIGALKSGQIVAAGLDVYEEEENIFFRDLSENVLLDDVLARLLTFPNVLITAHQGFLTSEAIHNIAETTLQSIDDFENNRALQNEITLVSCKK